MSLIKRFSNSLVKDGMDSLPVALCFFNQNGYLSLCNRQMRQLFFALLGRDLQMLYDLETALEHPIKGVFRNKDLYTFPDGKVWQFSKRTIQIQSGLWFLEVIAKDVTSLHKNQERLKKSNDEQRKVLQSLKQLSKYVVELSREQEILKIKTQLHNDLGDNLRLIHYAMQEQLSPEEESAFWKKQLTLSDILLSQAQSDNQVNPLRELYELAEILGKKIIIKGAFPSTPETVEILLDAMRVSLNNMIRHADGNTLTVELQYGKGTVHAKITNDGIAPQKTIVEGGGLKNLRSKIETAGGTMAISSFPIFALSLFFSEQEVLP